MTDTPSKGTNYRTREIHEEPLGDPGWVLVSGGKDSIATLHYLHEKRLVLGAIYLRTGTADPSTEPFVTTHLREMELPLEVYETPVKFEEFVIRWGFPKGKHGHRRAWVALKERPLMLAARAHLGQVFYTGVRKNESARRFGTVEPCSPFPSDKYHVPKVHLHAPLIEWSTPRVWKFLRDRGLSPSPCSLTIGISGDCRCLAFSSPGEVEAWKARDPEWAAQMEELERKCPHPFPYNRIGNIGENGFSKLKGRTTLDGYFCGGGCAVGKVA